LVFSYNLPATGRFRDFHPLDCAHAGRTKIMTTGLAGGLLCPYKGLFPACARKAPEGSANRTSFSG